MLTMKEVTAKAEIATADLHLYIQQSWILPIEEEGQYFFDDADLARIQLIGELRRDMGVNDEAVPIILQLIDRANSLHRSLEELHGALELISQAARQEIEKALDELQRN